MTPSARISSSSRSATQTKKPSRSSSARVEVGAEAGPLEPAPEVPLLAGVVEAGQPEVETLRAEPIQEPSDGLRAADRDDGDALGVEIPALPLRESLERSLVAEPFDQHDRLGGHDVSCEPGAAEPPSCCRPDR